MVYWKTKCFIRATTQSTRCECLRVNIILCRTRTVLFFLKEPWQEIPGVHDMCQWSTIYCSPRLFERNCWKKSSTGRTADIDTYLYVHHANWFFFFVWIVVAKDTLLFILTSLRQSTKWKTTLDTLDDSDRVYKLCPVDNSVPENNWMTYWLRWKTIWT